ncbi:methylated-DNA--protein-cysteine methyltransferase-like [Uloborus diversus]|uniref:methylated-DNA--protein-cysteine methyltransferase-like n=1 Tax=Uloborus diversus TaxID=327109 RepID=UPI00240957F9|nr:methylated-DNA--protein-cysteine methyltransferase-like [Uloborus diversus]
MTSPPICPTVFLGKGTFTKKVWTTLMSNVTIGKTLSYGELAKLCGNGAASRAVGSAMKNNPIPLLIPCHRVVKSDGSIGNFSCGVHVKEWLLNHENSLVE